MKVSFRHETLLLVVREFPGRAMRHFRIMNEVLSTRTRFVYLRKLDHTDASVHRVRFAFHGHVSLR